MGRINLNLKRELFIPSFYTLLLDYSHRWEFYCGSAGSGKSYISLAYALDALKDPSTPYRKIICFVPTCEAGAMSIGFLKGTLEEKIEPYLEADTYTMMKILDKSGNYATRQILDNLIKSKIINYELVNFARGKTYDDAIILLNESENYTKKCLIKKSSKPNSKKIMVDTQLGKYPKIGYRSKSSMYDILGYVDKEVERYYAHWELPDDTSTTPTVTDNIQNIDIYDKLFED